MWVGLVCGLLLYGKMFPPKLKGTAYQSYVRPAILHGSEVWCFREGEMGIYEGQEIHAVRNVWSAAQRLEESQGLDTDIGLE